jgi:hypothetical protein
MNVIINSYSNYYIMQKSNFCRLDIQFKKFIITHCMFHILKY